MIVFNLQCSGGHGFEAWFKDAAAFAAQRRSRKVACPVCGDSAVRKMPSAPRIAKGVAARTDRIAMAKAHAAAAHAALKELHEKVEKSCDYVGPRFAEEARKIHYGETEERGIYGEATAKEASELSEEGVPFGILPKLPVKDA